MGISAYVKAEKFRQQNWTGTFEMYLDVVRRNPQATRTAYQRLYDMVLSHGVEERAEFKEKIPHYRFFDDPLDGRDAIYGLDRYLAKLVNLIKAAAEQYGTERRILLLHGPVGSSKSTIVRLFKRGLELYSQSDEGILYSFAWTDLDLLHLRDASYSCPLREEPLKLVPMEERERAFKGEKLRVRVEGDLCPPCRYLFREFLKHHQGDWARVLDHVQIQRVILSEKDRVGIGTFVPKDVKSLDATDLTGDINYKKIAEYGSDSNPMAFNFDGEFEVANRGLVEFIEMLKLNVEFLYELLGASQEHVIKPKKFQQVDIDEVIIAHTNNPEYKRLQDNQFMEALRDRTQKLDVPYITRLVDEIKIYEKDFNHGRIRGKHIAPHTLEVASLWAVLTRLEDPKKFDVTLLQKLKLYNGKSLPGFTEDNVKELRDEAPTEGMAGISPRYIQDKISNALVAENSLDGSATVQCINPFMVLKELEEGLDHYSLITNKDLKERYRKLIAVAREEYEDILKKEVQRAISADEEGIKRLCGNYVDNLKAYVQKEKMVNKFTGEKEEPDEQLMRSIEDKINIPESRKDDFRREILNYIGALAIEGKSFDYRANERLYKALEAKLFEDSKDSIKLTTILSHTVVDKDQLEKIETVKHRLIRDYSYCEICAQDVLSFIASIFARGKGKEN
ncbi:MAG: serine protein kinase [Acidobacteria bacterium]|nr:serine protein kinase [Acidobacteriota bacterium]